MHPLSLFPSLLYLGPLLPALFIRLALGAVFLHWAYRDVRSKHATSNTKLLGILEAVVGILLVVGLWTQGAALVAALDLIVRLCGRIAKKAFLTDGVNYYLILLVLAISLLFTGAGFLAFDLPL